jgi:hypothetical protein
MQDYIYTRDTGEKVPVAKMLEEEIRSCLSGGIEINETDLDTINATETAVRKRLEIELLIRRMK